MNDEPSAHLQLIATIGDIFAAAVHDAEDEQKFCAGMGMNFEKILGDALEAYAARKVAEERERCAQTIASLVDLLCGAQSGFVRGSRKDCEWETEKDRALAAISKDPS
jgi:hypothetical protein